MKNLQWIWRYAAPIKWMILLSALLLALQSLAMIGIIGIQQHLIDKVIMPGSFDQLGIIVLVFVGMVILYVSFFIAGPHVMHLNIARSTKHVSTDFMNYLFRMPTKRLHCERTADLVHHFTQDIREVSWSISFQLPKWVQSFAMVAGLMVMIYMASPWILLFVLCCSSAYVVLGKLFSERMKNASKSVQEERSKLLVVIEEGISATREVVAFHRMKWERKNYDRVYGDYYDRVMDEGKVENRQLFLSEPLKWSVSLFILLFGGFLVLTERMSVGQFVVTFQFGSQFMNAVQNLFHITMTFFGQMGNMERIREKMSHGGWEMGHKSLQEKVNSLQLQGVSFRYADEAVHVVNDLHIELPLHKKLAFVGESGCGKSTMIQLITRAYEPQSGDVLVNGVPLRDWNRSDWMKKLAVVPQDPYLFPDTIEQNLRLGLEQVREEDVVKACQVAQIHDTIMSLSEGYQTVIGERGVTLSGGQKQRLAIARALLRDPEILILDEATSALDYKTERELQHELDKNRKGKTTIIVAHRLSTVQNADMIYAFEKGRLAKNGTHVQGF